MTKINTTTSSTPALTCREIQVLLKSRNHQSKLDRNLLIPTSIVNCSHNDLPTGLNDIDLCDQSRKQTGTNCDQMDGGIVTNINKENDKSVKTKTSSSKPFTCTLTMDLLFEEFDSKDIEKYVGKQLKTNVGKVYIFDEKATKELHSKIDGTNFYRLGTNECKSLNNQIPKRKPPPLPAKPDNLMPPEHAFQTFPIHKAFSLVEPLTLGEFQAPKLPKRNNTPKPDLPPIPPIRTTSMVKPGISGNSLSDDTIKSLDLPTEKTKKRSLFRLHERNHKLQIHSMPKINIDKTFVKSTLPILSSTSSIQAFTKDDVPYFDDPSLLDYQIEVSNESLNMTETEEALMTPISKTFPSLQFHSLPRMMTRESSDPMVSKSYHNLNAICKVEESDSDEEESLNIYEKISLSPDYENYQAMSVTKEQRKTKVLTKHELLVIDPSFFDFEVSPNKKCDLLNPSVERLLKSLFHQYDILEEVGSSKHSNGCEKYLTTACDREGNLYFIPKFSLKNCDDFTGEMWFYPLPLTPLQATCFLKDLSQFGSFMVYQSADEDCVFYLSVCVTDDVIHYKIEQDESLNYGINGSSRKFPSLKDLVEFYKTNRDSLVARLKRTTKEVNMTIKPGHHYPTKYEIDRKQIKFSSEVIGVGHFGTICIGTYDNQKVAIEVLELLEINSSSNICDKEDGLIEMISILDSLNHHNIIKMIGLSSQVYPCYFISEFSTYGTLKNFLKQNPCIDTSMMIDICGQMSAALSHLASKSYIIHRNIACDSFLVFEGRTIKLSKFHKARKVSEDVYISSPSDPILVKWASPEILIHQIYTTKSDVWSLAVCMWEVFMKGEIPYPSSNVECSALSILRGELLGRPSNCPKQIYDLMMQCWRLCLLDRPNAMRINRILTNITMQNYEQIDEKDADIVTSPQNNIKSIPEEEAPVVGIVKLRKKFFTQKTTTENPSSNRNSKIIKQTNESPKNGKTEQNKKEFKKNDRIFSLSDLNTRLRSNDESRRNLRAQHCKSYQADSSYCDKSRLNDTTRLRSN